MRRRYVMLGLAALAIGVFVVVYHGPGRPFLRGHVGDVAATMLVYALLGLARPSTRAWLRGVLTFLIALAIECVQLVWHAKSAIGSFLIGSQFDWIDLIAYAVGAAIGIIVASWGDTKRSTSSSR